MMRPWMGFVLIAIALLLVPSLQAQETKTALTNDDVLQMLSSGLSESVVLGAIAVNDVNFDVSAFGLLALKKAGVGDKILEAMLAAEQKKHNPSAPSPATTIDQDKEQAREKEHQQTEPELPAAHANFAAPMGTTPQLSPQMMPQMNPQMMSMIPPQFLAMMPAAARQQLMSQMGRPGMRGMGDAMLLNGIGGMGGGQLPRVTFLLDGQKQLMQASTAQIAQTKTKGGGGPGMGMKGASMLTSFGSQALSFAAIGSGAGMMAMPAMGMATGLIGGFGHHSSLPTTTYVWALPGHSSSFTMPTTSPKFEIEFGDIVGVDPDAYEPVLVRLLETKDNWRLVGATKEKMDMKGTSTRTAITEDRTPIKTTSLGRGHVQLEAASPLAPGEYGLVLHPIKPQKSAMGAPDYAESLFYSVWDFSVPGTETTTAGHKAH